MLHLQSASVQPYEFYLMNKDIHELLHMNFLPAERAEEALKVVRLRDWRLLAIAILIVKIAALSVLGASLLFMQGRIQVLENVYVSQQDLLAAAERSVSIEDISQQKNQIRILQQLKHDRTSATDALTNLASAVESVEHVNILQIFIPTELKQIHITGEAQTRDSLLDLVEKLKTIPEVSEVSYPPGIVFLEEPISFDIVVSL